MQRARSPLKHSSSASTGAQAIASKISRGLVAFDPKLGLLATPSGQIYYDPDWSAARSLAAPRPGAQVQHEWALQLAGDLAQLTDLDWLVGPSMVGGPSPYRPV